MPSSYRKFAGHFHCDCISHIHPLSGLGHGVKLGELTIGDDKE
jgi:hypothetical protein